MVESEVKEIYPSVRDLGISETRRRYIINNILETFNDTATSRRIVKIRHHNLAANFVRIGLNLIVDKIWFVDLPNAETGYAYQNIGLAEGKSIGLGETQFVLESIMKEGDVSENLIEYQGELEEAHLDAAISKLSTRGQNCDLIMTNISDLTFFWLKSFESFEGVDRSKSPFGLEGYFKKIPVYWSNFIPENTTFAMSMDVGELTVKKELDAEISEIREEEYEEIVKVIPGIKREELGEKVRLRADEVVDFEFKRREALTFLKCARKES